MRVSDRERPGMKSFAVRGYFKKNGIFTPCDRIWNVHSVISDY